MYEHMRNDFLHTLSEKYAERLHPKTAVVVSTVISKTHSIMVNRVSLYKIPFNILELKKARNPIKA